MDGQDGLWSVSVAETPHDATSYSLYIKTATHNLTLTRTGLEIVELHGKLRDSFPGAKLPNFPIDSAKLPSPPKRKSAFLNTLSRLASPSSKSSSGMRQFSGRQSNASSTTSSVISSGHPTPLASPTHEISDPFSDDDMDSDEMQSLKPTNSTITGLAAYLTTIANDATFRPSRVWKRFVRVRTDDLQSVRVERAIKRVRSDLAAHVSPGTNGVHRSISQMVMNGSDAKVPGQEAPKAPTVNGHGADAAEEVPQEDIEEDPAGESETTVEGAPLDIGADAAQDRAPTPRTPKYDSQSADDMYPADTEGSTLNGTFDGSSVSSMTASEEARQFAARIPRSQSAEPTSRASRIFLTPVHREGTSSQTSQTGDDSSVSTTGRRASRKKRSKSMDPNSEKKKSQRKVAIDDFEMMRVLGKGCAGKVLLVRHKPTMDVFALKAITKRHVLAHQELQHTLTEQAVLKRMAAEGSDPFVVKLWWSFHDKENLFLVMDFHPGGDLATQLARWGRLGRDRARFYAAEIVEGVEGLHAAGVIYRDLKPENILIGGDGHIVLTDFGLSKEFPRKSPTSTAPSTPSGFRGDFTAGTPTAATPHWMKGENAQDPNGWAPSGADTTSTFCGTAEYLAPEVIQGLPYSYEVDWWSFGTMLYEMLTGITPFWANNHSDMYYRVLQDELQFPEDRTMDQDTKSLIRGLLQRNPALRMKEPRIKKHPYFSMIDWSHVYYKRYIPPYIPPIDPSNASDTQNFDDTFLDMEPVINDENEGEQTDTEDRQTDPDGEDSATTPSQSRSPSVHANEDDSVDVFDGYSFKGRHSIIMDDEVEEDEEELEEEEATSGPASSTDSVLPDVSSVAEISEKIVAAEDVEEPKTPEARPATLPEPEPTAPASPIKEREARARKPDVTPRPSHEDTAPEPVVPVSTVPPPVPAEEIKPQQKPIPRARPPRQRGRREKSGIPALDRGLPDAIDEDEVTTEREEEDDWDFVEAEVSLRTGVVDRYKLAVFRKSTPRRSVPRTFSGVSMESDSPAPDIADSPTPSDKYRRGRTPGLTFRKHPKQFLRQRSPPASSRSSASKTLTHSASATLSASTTSSAGLLTPSQSSTSPLPIESSDQSINGDARHVGGDTIKGASVVSMDEDRQKNKVLKKYKEGAEKVLSIFQSPR
ncbi:kinase-like protein [Amylocystis lapponica]|nr:kinase-like protein [Amylocystis lapponica]